MMKNIVILAAGKGSKIWPYNEVRNKGMTPVANKPIIAYNVDVAIELGVERIFIVCDCFKHEIINYFSKYKNVSFVETKGTNGTVESLLETQKHLEDVRNFAVLYGDTIIQKDDLCKLLKSKPNTAILAEMKDTTRDIIGTSLSGSKLTNILGHPREGISHYLCGFHFSKDVWPYLYRTDGFFRNTEVGMMVPNERFIEATVNDMINDGIDFAAITAEKECFDIDKPWHILDANQKIVTSKCSELKENILEQGASIDKTADIRGFVKLGKNSKIGRNVVIEGNVIVGDNTVIDNGAFLQKDVVIGNNVFVGYSCFVASGTSIGNECFLGHASELWGIIMKRVYLYHYMEMYGIIGENTDIGAGTVCGNLRFDDANKTHRVKGRKELPMCHSNAIYLGDFSRTGVNTTILAGVKTGAYSLVGPAVLLSKDLPSRKAIFVNQDCTVKDWGPKKYGW